MNRTAYEVRRNHDGYGVYELHLFKDKVYEEVKLKEHDFLVIALQFLATHLQSTLPNQPLSNPLPPADEAATAKSEQGHKKTQK